MSAQINAHKLRFNDLLKIERIVSIITIISSIIIIRIIISSSIGIIIISFLLIKRNIFTLLLLWKIFRFQIQWQYVFNIFFQKFQNGSGR